MIKLDNVSKTYVSKSKSKVRALRGVSFELGSRGMVFILGKSGSGKSTLLNLLGGLDAPSGGVITVDGVSMEMFKQTDYDAYRNGYVGFVFQDFNLLNDFNVRDNVALALQLSNEQEIDAKVKDALAKVELSDAYLTRRVGELSGGERQRVAIARSIIKDSKLILADEPTGNLDSKTGESIWSILKDISKEKLVVVVSHDRDSATKYGDRIIEISDGLVVSDVGAQPDCDTVEQPFTPESKNLSLKTCLKIGVNSMFKRKGKTVAVILVSIFTILALLMTQMGLSFSPERTYAKFIKKYDVPYVNMSQGVERNGDFYRYTTENIRHDAVQYISQHADYILNGIVENKQQLIDFGFSFVGEALELTANSYYTTKYNLEKQDYLNVLLSGNRSYYIDESGRKVYLNRSVERLPMEELIGKQVYLDSCAFTAIEDDGDVPILAGIIDVSDEYDYFVSVPNLFARSDFVGVYRNHSERLNNNISEYKLQIGSGSFDGAFYLETFDLQRPAFRTYITADYGLVTTNGFGNASELTGQLADDEIVLGYALYAELFGAQPQSYYVDEYSHEMLAVPDKLGERLSFKICDSKGNVLADLGEYRLAAVGFDFRDEYLTVSVGTSTKASVEIAQQLPFGNNILVKMDKVSNVSRFLLKLQNDYGVYITSVGGMRFTADEITVGGTTITADDIILGNNSIFTDGFTITIDITYIVEAFDELLDFFVELTGLLCVVLTLVLLLMVVNLISLSIAARKKEIGILSALGTSTKDVTRIFIFETLVISAICFVVTLILAVVFALVFNYLFCGVYEYTLPLFKVDIYTILTLTLSSFGLLLLAALIPIRKIAQLKPIDAIRSIK